MEGEESAFAVLRLGEHKLMFDKKKLAKESLYFESLFSKKYADHLKEEYPINYDIEFPTFKDFSLWIDEDEYQLVDYLFIKPCLIKYTNPDNYLDLIKFLQLSVLFTVDQLKVDIVDIIIRHHLKPENLFDLWSVAEQLNLKVLKRVIMQECVSRLKDIPREALLDLCKERFIELMHEPHLLYYQPALPEFLLERYRQLTNTNLPALQQAEQQTLDTAQQEYLKCIIDYKLDSSLGEILCIYYLKNNEWVELATLPDGFNSGKKLTGMHILGRGHNIYIIGGEKGIGTGHFNEDIWQYCLFSKKWYYVSSLRTPRRHMAAGFLGESMNLLLLAGGIGRHRLKLSSVEILNLHTGEWTDGASIPEDFTETPPCDVYLNNFFVYCKSNFYFYNLQENKWFIKNNTSKLNVHALRASGSKIVMNAAPSDVEDTNQFWVLDANLENLDASTPILCSSADLEKTLDPVCLVWTNFVSLLADKERNIEKLSNSRQCFTVLNPGIDFL